MREAPLQRRHFDQRGMTRGFSATIIPAASEEDALAFVNNAQTRMLNMKAMGLARSEPTIERIEIPGANDAWCNVNTK